MRQHGSANWSLLAKSLPVTWMRGTFVTFDQMNSADILNATSSLGSEDGPSPSSSPAGHRTVQSGQDHARANLSARQAQESGLLTSGTYGRTGSTLSESARLQASLASRLQARMGSDGSILYRLTWKERVTPSGFRISALRASARPTSDNVSILERKGWSTPSARDWKDTAGMATSAVNPDGSERTRLDQLPRQAALAGWPTLSEVPGGPMRLTVSGQMLTGSFAGMESGGQLNPDLSRWLMGYPAGWASCGATVMQSSRRSPQRSSKPLKRPDALLLWLSVA